MNQSPIPNAFRRMRYQWWTARMIQKTKMITKNRLWRIWQNGTETMTEHWNTLNTHCVLQHEATESSMSRTAWPTRSSQPAHWSTNINEYQQISSGSTWEIFGMVLHATSNCGCAKASVYLHLNMLNIWIEAAHLVESSALCNRHRRSISWDNFKIEAYAWFLQQNHLFAHWLPHAFVHFLRSTSTSMRGKHDNMTLSPVSSVCSHPTAWTITKQAGFLRRSHLLSDVHTTEGNSLQSIKVQLATAVEHQAIVAAKETLRAVIEPLSQNCVRKKNKQSIRVDLCGVVVCQCFHHLSSLLCNINIINGHVSASDRMAERLPFCVRNPAISAKKRFGSLSRRVCWQDSSLTLFQDFHSVSKPCLSFFRHTLSNHGKRIRQSSNLRVVSCRVSNQVPSQVPLNPWLQQDLDVTAKWCHSHHGLGDEAVSPWGRSKWRLPA